LSDLQIEAIIIALIGVLGGVLPYVYTRNKEINASIRQEKIKRYDELIGALRMFFRKGFENDPEIMNEFSKTYVKASAYASDLVLEKCNDLLTGFTKGVDTKTRVMTAEAANKLLDIIEDIYAAIRKDINPKARYFKVRTFWAELKED
jgi:hypothetical protein